jgi:uncharacterized protein YndB with AHSA1/START domain
LLHLGENLAAALSYPVVLADVKINIRSPQPRVFESLLTPGDIAAWWGPDAIVEAEVGGRYETNPPEGRQAGLILGLEAPRRITYSWDLPVGGAVVETTVTFELSPRGPDTFLHLVHRARSPVGTDWSPTWHRAADALKTYLESERSASTD